ncbi:DinB family protein [Halomonas elongata]|uniref:DinB family protein n=1 Tax=Halomonas elongata TaxID=2746 RepID=UPI0023B0876C|nr:DinB family protein [Halomonas elongata]
MMQDDDRPMAPLAGLVVENRLALSQLREFIEDLTPTDYCCSLGSGGRHSIGRHLRHIIDHYDALLSGAMGGRVDYERRRREVTLEQWPAEARARLEDIDMCLARLGGAPPSEELSIDYPVDGSDCQVLASSLARELAFLTSHTIHHMAILGLLAESLDIGLPATFGVHPSTLRHWEQSARPQADKRSEIA